MHGAKGVGLFNAFVSQDGRWITFQKRLIPREMLFKARIKMAAHGVVGRIDDVHFTVGLGVHVMQGAINRRVILHGVRFKNDESTQGKNLSMRETVSRSRRFKL